MKPIKSLLLFTISITLISSCFDPPEFPNTPQIAFESLEFFEVGNNAVQDCLLLKISFKDGDGDLGLEAEDIDSPYNQYHFYLDNTGKIARAGSTGLSDNTPILPFEYPYNCLNYVYETPLYVPEADKSVFDETYTVTDTILSGGTVYYEVVDTFYVEKNLDHYNIEVKFFSKNNPEDPFVEFNWETIFPFPQCGDTFNGRFPVLSDNRNSLEGILSYAMKSSGFRSQLNTKRWKIQVQIKDRALHTSNVIEKEFTLTEIRKKG